MQASGEPSNAGDRFHSVIAAHPEFGGIAVIVDGSRDTREYFGYLLGRHVPEVEGRALRDCLAAHGIPDVPDSLVFVPAGSLLSHAGTANSGCPLVEFVTGVCAKVLKLDQVDPAENFMDAGGQSLAGLKVVDQLDLLFHVRIPVSELFTCSTIAEIAQVVERYEPSSGRAEFIAATLLAATTQDRLAART